MWIKICGNTNLDDALLAAELGADALGFIFAPSKRQVTAGEVARITSHIPQHIERVGVFDSHNAGEIAAITREAGLTAIQLHGGLDQPLLTQLHEIFEDKVTLIQTLHWTIEDPNSAANLAAQLGQIHRAAIVRRVLIDSKVGQASGGTGLSFDWETAKAVLSKNANGLDIIVAGGLRPDNVAAAIHGLSPWGVDVSSGVEREPRKKDPEKLTAFIKNARQAIQKNLRNP
jgi:phosphoribosylanthranilate isomerase